MLLDTETPKKIEKFLKTKTNKQKIIVIYGPTGSGKTKTSIDIAKKLDTEIISADSRQIFKYMDIGTGKITEKEKKGVKHHMIDIIEPDKKYSVSEFQTSAKKIVNNLQLKGKIPIICGGTGLYIDSLIYDFEIPKFSSSIWLRQKLELEAKMHGKQAIFEKLKSLDPDYDKNIETNNLRHIIRAIEVKLTTGKSKTQFKKTKKLKYDVFFLSLKCLSRENLYNTINTRVKKMFDLGLVEENKKLLNMGYKKDDFGMKSIGYKEVLSYINGDINLEESIFFVQKNSRNYAKRQLTWFRDYPD